MTETFTEDKWKMFESSGRVSDYLYYKGIGVTSISAVKGEKTDADYNRGNGDLSKGAGR